MRNAKWVCSLAMGLIAFSVAEASVLVGPPQSSAGIVEKQIQKEYEVQDLSPTKELPLLDVDVPKEKLVIPQGRPVLIHTFVFTGNHSLSDKDLQKIVAPYVGRSLHGQEVQEMCLALQSYYVEQGYILARVFPPAQDVRDHTLKIEVLEGTLGSITIEGNKHYSAKFVRKFFSSMMGESINYNRIIRALLLLNENMDMSAGAIFKKGKNTGEADLVIVVKDKLPLHIYTDYNNYGSSITTQDRAGARIDYGNLITSGDKISLIEVLGFPPDHLNFSNAIYSAPLTGNGLRLDLSYLYSRFKVDRLNTLNLSGRSNVAGFRFNQPLARTRRFSTDVFFGFDYKQLKNLIGGATDSFDKLRVLVLGGKLDYIDSVKGRNTGDFYVSAGIPNFLGGLHAIDSECSRKGAGGRYFIFNLDFRRIQQLPLNCFLIFSVSGQGTLNKLPISEQIYIGGIDTVRGYPLATALGDNGYYGTLELSVPPPFLANKRNKLMKKDWKDVLRFVGFVDQGGVFDNGHVQQEKDPCYLTSSGVGLRLYGPWNFNLNFDVGFPLTKDHKSSDTILYLKVGLKII